MELLRIGLSVFLSVLIAAPARALSVVPPPDINYTDLHKAAAECDLEQGRAAIDALSTATHYEEINRLDREGATPLAYAAKSGCIGIVKPLIEAGAALDATDDYARWTPLLHAANQHHAEVVQFLLAHGANVDARAGLGQTPLTEAILGSYFNHGTKGNRDATVQVPLLSGADVNLQGQSRWSPLMTAVFMGDANLVRLLIGKGADLSATDTKGKTALNYAEERDEQEIVDILKDARPTTR